MKPQNGGGELNAGTSDERPRMVEDRVSAAHTQRRQTTAFCPVASHAKVVQRIRGAYEEQRTAGARTKA